MKKVKPRINIVLLGKPLSTNHIYAHRGHIVYLKANAKKLRNNYVSQIETQYKGKPLEGPLSVTVEMYRHGREPDRDNIHKLSMDAMNGLIFVDDKQIVEAHIYKKQKDNKTPRLHISIKELYEAN